MRGTEVAVGLALSCALVAMLVSVEYRELGLYVTGGLSLGALVSWAMVMRRRSRH
jgi:hypothetical protein